MELHILSRTAAHEFVKKNPDVPIIVIKETNASQAVVQEILNTAQTFLYLIFDDIELPRESKYTTPPSKEDVRRAFEWAKDKDEVVVTCQVGVSRSAAIAYVIACSKMPPEDALQFLNKSVHSPNQLIVRLGANYLNNEEVYYALMRWVYGSEEPSKFV